RMIWHNNAYIF
nr:immunoglobulin light chain junction region [Macaca mulatta]